MLDSDAFGKVLEYIDGGARLAVWLTCKAFNKHRPVGKFTTSVCAVCANPAMFDLGRFHRVAAASSVATGCGNCAECATLFRDIGTLNQAALAQYISAKNKRREALRKRAVVRSHTSPVCLPEGASHIVGIAPC
jgi:C4-type Zn-finger protein